MSRVVLRAALRMTWSGTACGECDQHLREYGDDPWRWARHLHWLPAEIERRLATLAFRRHVRREHPERWAARNG